MKIKVIFIITASLILLSLPTWAASTKDEVLTLQAQVAEIQKDLEEIKKLLKEGARAPAKAAQPAFKPQTVSIGTSPVKGRDDARVTLFEYSDYQCPFCARNYREVLPVLQKEYIDTGKIKFVMRENPLPQLHKDANNASLAALCANDQEKYWEMHDIMFENPRQLSIDDLKSYAADIGLDTNAFNSCLDTKKHEKAIRRDMAVGSQLGVRGTPGFVLGLTNLEDPDKVNAMVFIKGAQGIDKFRLEIDKLLESAE